MGRLRFGFVGGGVGVWGRCDLRDAGGNWCGVNAMSGFFFWDLGTGDF